MSALTDEQKRAIIEHVEPRLWSRGPNRVVVDAEGTAVTHQQALRMGFIVHVYFIRDDGWVLGAPQPLEEVAQKLWEDKWVGKFTRGEGLALL